MNLTQEIVIQEIIDGYIGGRVEVRNRDEDYLTHSEIAGATITDEGDGPELKLTLKWTLQLVNSKWVESLELELIRSLSDYKAITIGARWIVMSSVKFSDSETIVLIPQGRCTLEPSVVRDIVGHDGSA